MKAADVVDLLAGKVRADLEKSDRDEKRRVLAGLWTAYTPRTAVPCRREGKRAPELSKQASVSECHGMAAAVAAAREIGERGEIRGERLDDV